MSRNCNCNNDKINDKVSENVIPILKSPTTPLTKNEIKSLTKTMEQVNKSGILLSSDVQNSRQLINISVELCHPDAKIPKYANNCDSGCDIYATEDVIIHPQETKIVKTGLKVVIPNGYEIQIRPRSGISLKTKLRVSNSPGTIDSGYRDEIGIIMTNMSTKDEYIKTFSNNTEIRMITLDDKVSHQGIYKIRKGDRIAQLVLCKVPKMNFVKVEDVLSVDKNNRKSGFGGTGVR